MSSRSATVMKKLKQIYRNVVMILLAQKEILKMQ